MEEATYSVSNILHNHVGWDEFKFIPVLLQQICNNILNHLEPYNDEEFTNASGYVWTSSWALKLYA